MNLKNYISGDIQFKPLYKSLTDEIKKKTSSEPQWVAKISDNLIQENQKAKNINSKELISETNERLKQFDKELNEIGKMDNVTKNKPHLVSYMENKYQPIENKRFASETGIKTGGENNKTTLSEFNKTNATIRGVTDKTGLDVSAGEDDLSTPASITMENISKWTGKNAEGNTYGMENMVVTDTDDFQVEDYRRKYKPGTNTPKNKEELKSAVNDYLITFMAVTIQGFAMRYGGLEGLSRSKNAQREVWQWGAENYLKPKGCLTAARMLTHSLQDKPSNIWEGSDSDLAQQINNDPEYIKKVDDLIANSDGKSFEAETSIIFGSEDLQLSINKAELTVSGYKREDGKWELKAFVHDTYDFTEILTMMDNHGIGKATIANDVAAVSQKMGAITPYDVYVEIITTR